MRIPLGEEGDWERKVLKILKKSNNFKEELEKMGCNSIRLEISGGAEQIVGGTRFGGTPDVPEGFIWPEFETDTFDDSEVRPRPLAFLAQFNCAEIAPLDREGLLPRTGLLSFFYELDSQCWGFDPKDKGCARVFWFVSDRGLSPAEFPDSLGADFRLPPIRIALKAEASFPGQEDFALRCPECASHDELFQEIRGGWEEAEENISKLLGWPDIIQNNMTTECELVSRGYYLGNTWKDIPRQDIQEAEQSSLENWRLLFQLDIVEHDNFELMFGDCGRIYFYIRREDLAARRFDRVWLILQCY